MGMKPQFHARVNLHGLSAPVSPSGRQVELESGEQRAVVVGVGGGLRSYAVGGRQVLDGYAADEMCPSGRGQLLIPWPNRIEDGSYEFDGRSHQLALDEPVRSNAIHGLVRWANWTVAEHSAASAALELELHPQPGYPFSLALRAEYTLSDEGLTVRTEATNVGADPCPYGAGAHPYLAVGEGGVDEVALELPADTVLESNERSLPVGSAPVEEAALDFRAARPIGPAKLDHCFTGLARDADGRARVRVGGAATLWVDESYPYLMVFTGDALPDVARRSLAVEPMTCPPNAFRSGDGLVRLEPGDMHTGSWGIKPELVGL